MSLIYNVFAINIQYTIVIGLVLLLASSTLGRERRTIPSLKRSDVVFCFGRIPDSEAVKAYNGTWKLWGGAPEAVDSINGFGERIQNHHQIGLKYAAGFGMIHTFRQLIDLSPYFLDAVCTNLQGSKLTTWRTDWFYKGHPAYWNLDIHPLFKKYVNERVRWTVRSKPDALHFDDPFGASRLAVREGVFNKQYIEGFREFLKIYVPEDTLIAHGITDLEHFDYSDFLREIESKAIAQAVGSEGFDLETVDYNKVKMNIKSFPLIEYYQCYTYRCAIENMKRVKKIAREEAGMDIPMSGNAAYGTWDRLGFAPVWDYLSPELHFNPEKGLSAGGPILDYKVGETLETPIAAIGYGNVWAFIKAHDATGLARGWIAECYAFGHNLAVPYNIWCRTKELGTHWYTAPVEEIAPLYRFVRQNAQLFDDYESIHDVGLLLNFADYRKSNKELMENAVTLANLNVPFGVAIAGEPLWMDYIQLTQKDLNEYSVLIVPENLHMDSKQKRILDNWEVKNKVIIWRGEEEFLSKYTSPIQVKNAKNVRVVPRAIPDNLTAPVVCHLLNRNYNPANDSYTPCRLFTVTIDNSLFQGRTFSKVTMYTYDSQKKTLQMGIYDGKMNIQIPELDVWAIFVLE